MDLATTAISLSAIPTMHIAATNGLQTSRICQRTDRFNGWALKLLAFPFMVLTIAASQWVNFSSWGTGRTSLGTPETRLGLLRITMSTISWWIIPLSTTAQIVVANVVIVEVKVGRITVSNGSNFAGSNGIIM